jgi:polyferredoxin
MLRVLPATLLATSLMGAMGLISLDLADLEPFNAYSWRTAGMFTVVTAVLGILSSAFVPMAFCRFACPTGALLKFLRLFKNSDRWVFRDSIALVFFLTAVALHWITF